MGRLIDAEVLMGNILAHCKMPDWCYALISAEIDEQPTVEAVPVVRCKDCKHWGTGVAGETERVKCCKYGGYMVGENGYCVYGEKKE